MNVYLYNSSCHYHAVLEWIRELFERRIDDWLWALKLSKF